MNVIGLDIGTTTLSAVVLDAQTGRARGAATVNSGSKIVGRPWEDLQDPERIVRRALAMVDELSREHGPIGAIGLTGQMHGMLYIDAHGAAVSPLFTWQDMRCEQPMPGADETYAQHLNRLTGHFMATGFGAATHFWHTVNDCVPGGAHRFATIHDYVGMKLTGRTAPLTHASDAASFGLFDRARGAFDAQAVSRAGLDIAFFPDVDAGTATLGRTANGVPVSIAIGDNQAGFIGTVREPNDSVMVSVGTSGQVNMLGGVRALPEGVESRPLTGGDSILVGASLCGGRAYAQLERFLRACAQLGGAEPGDLYPVMNALGEEALAFEDQLTVDTRFSGTRQHPEIRGAIAGIGTDNLTPAHLIGGVLTGIARELFELYEAMLLAGAAPRAQLIGAGNALRRNPALARAFERVFGLTMRMPKHREETATGAALFGMAAAGLCTLAEAQSLIQYE